jgi:hypothetical protein
MKKEALRVATFAGHRTELMIVAATEDLFPGLWMTLDAMIPILKS